ncbi:MAG: hypothetical protein JWO94_3604 [Verrucomicrobiaceae bacterium]|nr:hypothetical protein [Verrucomicrobiaceae bacterium]
MRFIIQSFSFHVLPMRTRFPFKYGIASMSALPHLFVLVHLEVNGRAVQGLSSEGLPPKWFTKDPDTLFEQDLAEMLAVIKNAARIAQNAAERPVGFFEWWQSVYEEQAGWANIKEVPTLLANLGTSLIERAVVDGLCKAAGKPLHQLVAGPALGINLGAVREELQGMSVAQAIPSTPLQRLNVRHTVGLGDPLRTVDIPVEEKLEDGLPHALDESIRAYGLRYFKIKVCGKPEQDLARLREITSVLVEGCGHDFHCTLDGNEQFQTLESFRDFYDTLAAEAALKPLFANLILIEQPLHRAHALDDAVAVAFEVWKNGPAMIIDESDGSLSDLPRALLLGYRGVSHKNCKGVVKGLANAALLKKRGLTLLSGEDLAGVGPVAMLQDLSMMALLGITHVERNGHHYFKGISMYPDALQEQVLAAHGDLYHRHPNGFPSLAIRDGTLELGSVNSAPFGCGVTVDLEAYEPLNTWIKRGGMGEL